MSDVFVGTLPRGIDNRADPQHDPEPVLIGMEFAGNYTLQWPNPGPVWPTSATRRTVIRRSRWPLPSATPPLSLT